MTRLRDGHVRKGQADRREEVSRSEENNGQGGYQERRRHEVHQAERGEKAGKGHGRIAVGVRVHPARAGRASLLAREVRARHVLIQRPPRRERSHHAVGWRPQLRRPEFHARRNEGWRPGLLLPLEHESAGDRRRRRSGTRGVPGSHRVRQIASWVRRGLEARRPDVVYGGPPRGRAARASRDADRHQGAPRARWHGTVAHRPTLRHTGHRTGVGNDPFDGELSTVRMDRHLVLALGLVAISATTTVAQRPRDRVADAVPSARLTWPDSTSWRHLGPAAFGGRIDDIEAVADDPRIIFVGAAAGGVFRSVNNGVTWEPVLDRYANTLSVGDIAIAPSDRNVVWVGMGEPNGRQSSTWGDGVYRSLDGGTT